MTPLDHYVRLLDQLLWERAVGEIDEDREEWYAVTLNDFRRTMTPDQEAQIEPIVQRRLATAANASLGLKDVDPPKTDDAPLRSAA